MPALFTHYICGKKALELIKSEKVKNTVNKHIQVFNLGTQGPDTFFFHRAWPWTRKQSINRIGKILHTSKVSAFFSRSLDYILNEAGKDADILSSYLYGFTCHYALDLHAHPYVFYKTGFVRSGEPPTTKFTSYHNMFETIVDVLMLKKMLYTTPNNVNASSLIHVNSREANAIGKMYKAVLRDVYGLKTTCSQVVTAITDMKNILAVLHDNTGVKRKLLRIVESQIGSPGLISSIIYPLDVSSKVDYLNSKHTPWSLPWDKTLKRTDSFYEIFKCAAQESAKLCETISSFLCNKIGRKEALNLIGNRSFHTGEDCSLDLEFKYYDCIFMQKGQHDVYNKHSS